MMTSLLEKAFSRASGLPEVDQNAIAFMIFEEIESERGWTAAFSASQEALAKMADAALAEYRLGRTR